MYNNIKEFREFIASATDEQIEKVVNFLNMVEFYQGHGEGIDYDDFCLAKDAVEYAKSSYDYVEDFLIARLGINVED